MDKKITGIEGRKILDEEVARLKRQMDARRHKTKSVARKKIEKNYEKLMKKGWDKRDFDMDTVFIIRKNMEKVDDYEESNTGITCKQITMSYTISQWESIKKWYPENTPTMPIKKFLDFSVFLASNEEVN
ncbi:hypothetical protein GGI20_005714, partial [Coemansia sp. BCRC 34301]